MRPIVFVLFMLIVYKPVSGQMNLTLTIKQPDCIKSIGHNFQQLGDGTIFVKVTGGIPPYTFNLFGIGGSINLSQNNNYFPGLPPGQFYVTVYDAIGKSQGIAATLTAANNTPFISSVLNIPATNCTLLDGSITLSVLGGTAPYWYSIDGGTTFNTSGTFGGLPSGIYAVLAKDNNGCMTSWDNSLLGSSGMAPPYSGLPTLNNNCGLSFFTRYTIYDRPVPLTSCNSEGGVDLAVTYVKDSSGNPLGNNLNLKYSTDGINYQSPHYLSNITSDDIIVYNQPAGIIPIYIKDTVTNLTTVFNTVVGKSCDVYISFIKVAASCGTSDGAFTIQARNGNAPYTYSMDGINFVSDSSFSGLAAGNYSVSVKDAIGDITSSIATIYNKCPKILATAANTFCSQNNGSIQAHGFLGTKPYQFSLDNINYQTDSLFTGLGKNNFTVYMKDAKNFIDSIPNISVSEICLNVVASVTNENCNQKNGSIIATGSNGKTPYQFSIDGFNFNSNNVFSNLDSGNYVLTIKDADNITDTIHLKILNNTPTISLGRDTTLCSGNTLQLSPNASAISYAWSDGSSNNILHVNSTGSYWVKVNINGCNVSDTINVYFLSKPNHLFSTNDTTICIGKTLPLVASFPSNSYVVNTDYLWNNNSTDSAIIINSTGKYWVRLRQFINQIDYCSVSDSINCVFVNGPPKILPKDSAFCSGKSIVITAGDNSATYLWNNKTTNNNLIVSQAGQFTVAITSNGCTKYDTVSITRISLPKISLGNDTTLCAGQSLQLNVSTNNATYLWQDGSVASSYLVSKEGVYSTKVTANGCDTTGQVFVRFITKPIINLGADTSLCMSNQLILNAYYPNSTYLWQDFSSQPNYKVTQSGTFNVRVTNGCGTSIDSISVAYQICECEPSIPSAFSPNGDGINDDFRINLTCVPAYYHLTIFNRYGQPVFSSTNPNEYWNGKYNNKSLPLGTYYYVLQIKGQMENNIKQKSGGITILY